MNTSSYLKLSRHNVYIFRRRIPKSLLDFFNTNELRISTKTSDKKIALYIARSIANESDLLFQQLITNKNMTDKKDSIEKEAHLSALQRTIDHAKLTNYLRNKLEEESDSRVQEMIEGKRKIKELEATHERTLNQQEAVYKRTLDAASGLVSEKLNNSASTPKIDFKLSELVEDFLSPKSIARRTDKPATVRKDMRRGYKSPNYTGDWLELPSVS